MWCGFGHVKRSCFPANAGGLNTKYQDRKPGERQRVKSREEQSRRKPDGLSARNRRTGLVVLGAVAAMVGLSFASVPLYSLFCRVTGFGGTTQVSQSLPEKILARKVTVRFDANTSADLPWDFGPETKALGVRLGERGLARFYAQNNAQEPVAGTALFNVTPLKVGKYFRKIQCFCFDEQILQPGQRVSMPVMFYVDPALDDDPSMEDVTTITLSYSFFKTDSAALDRALEAFYNSE